jgi:hypothetical protein
MRFIPPALIGALMLMFAAHFLSGPNDIETEASVAAAVADLNTQSTLRSQEGCR